MPLLHQHPDKRQREQDTQSARADGQPGVQRRVTHETLKEKGQHRDERVNHRAEHQKDPAAGGKVAVLEDAQVDDGKGGAQLLDDEPDE